MAPEAFLIVTVAWDVFATALYWGTRSLEMNRDLTDQIYHPRAILPFGNMAPALLSSRSPFEERISFSSFRKTELNGLQARISPA